MRALRPMTQEEREFAEQRLEMVMDYLGRKHLPVDDFYDIVIFGYLSAVQQYFRNPPLNVTFEAMAVRTMKDSILRDREYRTRPKRYGSVVSMDEIAGYRELPDSRQNTMRKVENKVLLEQAVGVATLKEASIIHLLVDGFALHEAARSLKMTKATVVSCMEEFCCRARAAIG